jgi:hypothetical protein
MRVLGKPLISFLAAWIALATPALADAQALNSLLAKYEFKINNVLRSKFDPFKPNDDRIALEFQLQMGADFSPANVFATGEIPVPVREVFEALCEQSVAPLAKKLNELDALKKIYGVRIMFNPPPAFDAGAVKFGMYLTLKLPLTEGCRLPAKLPTKGASPNGDAL